MIPLITTGQAVGHLRIADPSTCSEALDLKMWHATAIVLDYIARPTDAAWTATIAAWDEETVPPSVQAAILQQLAELWRYRGDDTAGEHPAQPDGGNDLSPAVKNYLKRFRDSVLA